jgi:hypothetical protein
LLLAALSAGFSAATKPNGLIGCLLLFFVLALALVKETEKSFTKIASDLLILVVVGALPLLPWLVKNWLQTGNPFFPLLGGFFPAHSSVVPTGMTYVSLGVLTKRELFYGETWWQIAALPLRVFLFGKDDDPQYFDGVLSPILILLLPWAFKGKWTVDKKFLLSFAALFFAYALFLVDLRIRYILPMVPALVALLVYSVFNIYLRIRRPDYLFAALLFFVSLNTSYLWNYWQEEKPIGYLFGRERREDYLARRLAEFPAYQYANRELPSTAKIYLLFVGRRAYYCEREYFHDAGELPGFLFAALTSAKEPADIGRQLKAKRLTHLLVRDDLLERFLGDNLDPGLQRLWASFASDHLRPLYRVSGYSVLELHG